MAKRKLSVHQQIIKERANRGVGGAPSHSQARGGNPPFPTKKRKKKK